MTLMLEIPEDLEQSLSAEAEGLGLPLGEYALRLLSLGRALPPIPEDGPGLVEYWNAAGLIGNRAAPGDAVHHARELRNRAERQVRD